MINIVDYAHKDKIQDFCTKIGIPDEAAGNALAHIGSESFLAVSPFFERLFDHKKAEESVKSINNIFTGTDGTLSDSGFGVMAVFLAAALRTEEIYTEKGIPKQVYFDTMSFFNEILGENLLLYGKYTFDRASWYYRQINCLIHKLGVLEYELKVLGKTESGSEAGLYEFPDDTPVLSVHIQTGSVMTRETLDNSYQTAKEFYPKYYPDFKFKAFVCDSWLLSPVLRCLLPESSKIKTFMSDYTITHYNEDTDFYFPYVFNSNEKPPDLNDLPEDTSLRRAIKHHLLNGGKIGSGCGKIEI